MGKIKAQKIFSNGRARLLYVIAQNALQRCLQKMGCRVVSGNAVAIIETNLAAYFISCANRALLHPGLVDKHAAEFADRLDLKRDLPCCYGSHIAGLPAAFAIEGGPV